MMNILTPSVPKRHAITTAMVEDFVWDPVLAAKFFFGVELETFQKCRLKTFWHVPFVMDSSGFSSGKTITDWVYVVLRCLIIPNHAAGVYYPTFDTGKSTFWPYFSKCTNPIYLAHLGRLDETGEEAGKSRTSEAASCWAHFKNGSSIMLPAPSFMKEAMTQASKRFNTLLIEEWTHIDAMGPGIDKQLLGRATKPSYNNDQHPLWTNHVKYTAPAKTKMHPGHVRVKKIEKQIAKGNPHYSHVHWCYKDFRPDFKDAEGQTVRMEEGIKNLRSTLAPAEWLAEGLGIWSVNTDGWYTEEDLLRCVQLGSLAKILPLSSRAQDPDDSPKVMYFGGVDPAPAQAAKNDDGAIVLLRVKPLLLEGFSDNPGDYDLRWSYARRVRNADAGQWGGIIHALQRAFGIMGWLMDWGAAGGGPFVKKELAKTKQTIMGVPTDCTPILTPEDAGIEGTYNLNLFKRSDPGIDKLWSKMAGDDVMIDFAHMEMREAIMKGFIKWMRKIEEWPKEELEKLSEEQRWSVINIMAMLQQFLNIVVAKSNDGEQFLLTKNGARSFSASTGKKDIQTAGMMAYIRFLIWLRQGGAGEADEKEIGFSASRW